MIHIYIYIHNTCVCLKLKDTKERWGNIEPWDSGPPNPQTNLGYPCVDWCPFRLIPIPMCLRFYEIRNSLKPSCPNMLTYLSVPKKSPDKKIPISCMCLSKSPRLSRPFSCPSAATLQHQLGGTCRWRPRQTHRTRWPEEIRKGVTWGWASIKIWYNMMDWMAKYGKIIGFIVDYRVYRCL